MHPIIKESINGGISYRDYRELVEQLADEHSNTGIEKTEALANYTKLNDRRMRRWDKTIKISKETQQKISEFNQKMTLLIITESWCGDAAHVIPALNKMAELNPNIDVKLVLRDENLELMDMFLTKGGRAIPKVIMIDDETGAVLSTYGPRPSEASSYVNRFVAKNGSLTPEFKEDLQHWYNGDKGQNIIKDVIEILSQLEPICQ
ncbi:thioredoxin family protein [uncultured Algibacter sp.]|jgi:thiol-disulfide isomerase/thioredoxin|uniref:thioredoxin family protein n=1 Tax=uncultured Algibacter sp. TaxID=298659 RepID=UPI0025E42B4B|nr:thioredoxin family protein [uncultured Algibacter sp.]